MASTAFDRIAHASTAQPGSKAARAVTAQAAPAAPTPIVADVEAALRILPSHGASRGWTGRRDRALLVLSQVAGLPRESIIELTAGDIAVANGVATIRTPGGTTTLHRRDDVLICAPCALARWLHALDLTVSQPAQVAASVIARCAPLTARSPHLCDGELTLAPATRLMPVFPMTDSWGPHPCATEIASAGTAPVFGALITGDTPLPERIPLQGNGNERTRSDPSTNRPRASERSTSGRSMGGRKTGRRAAADGSVTLEAFVRTSTLRLSRYPDPMEPVTARQLRQHLDRAARDLSAFQPQH